MTVYATDRRLDHVVNGVADRWSHLLADTPSELTAAANALGLGNAIHERGRPWCYVDITEAERVRAIEHGAQPVDWRAALREMQRRAAGFRWPDGGRRPTPFDVAQDPAPAAAPASSRKAPPTPAPLDDAGEALTRHEPRLAALYAAQAPDLPAGVFACGPTRRAAAWKADKPRHAWDEPKDKWHRCEHCGVLYRSVPLAGAKWVKQWEWPDGWGSVTPNVPPCPGPNHAHAVSRLPAAAEA